MLWLRQNKALRLIKLLFFLTIFFLFSLGLETEALSKKAEPSYQKAHKTSKKVRKYRKKSRRWRPYITARSAIVMDADTGKIYYQKAARRPGQPASTIKVLTALLALEYLNDDDFVYVSRNAAKMPKSKVYLRAGHFYQARDLIYACLLKSANDASVALAEAIAGSEKAFAQMMTAYARAIGAKDTICKTATGLTAPGQQTTAYDLAIIFREAMTNPHLASILTKRRATLRGVKKVHLLHSHNQALWLFRGCLGGKTGYTAVAGRTYVGMFERNGRRVIVAFLGSRALWRDLGRLLRKVPPKTYVAQKKRQKGPAQGG
ncbi:D-alanyl-D-alanine carboxypeptidase family protein [Thermosulfuriphilus sp.]